MNIKTIKEQSLDLFSNIKEQVVKFIDEDLPKAKEYCTQAKNAVADAVTKRAGAKIYLECDTRGNYKITLEGKKAAVRDALEKLLQEKWLCNSK